MYARVCWDNQPAALTVARIIERLSRSGSSGVATDRAAPRDRDRATVTFTSESLSSAYRWSVPRPEVVAIHFLDLTFHHDGAARMYTRVTRRSRVSHVSRDCAYAHPERLEREEFAAGAPRCARNSLKYRSRTVTRAFGVFAYTYIPRRKIQGRKIFI